MSKTPEIVTRADWLKARQALLVQEKAFARERDALSAARRSLPWVKIKNYKLEGSSGPVEFSDLFGDHGQLVVYHFMFAPGAKIGCKICSFWADNFEMSQRHLGARDVALAVVSRAEPAVIDTFKTRMGWTFPWLSGGKSTFNQDFAVSFSEDEIKSGSAKYNYGSQTWIGPDMPGVSVFARDSKGSLFHTYSTYARGLEDLNATYRYLDIVPKGRNEDGRTGMSWVKHRDKY